MTDFAKYIKTPQPEWINSGLTMAKQTTMHSLFGKPGQLSENCSEVTNPTLKKAMKTVDVGPFRVTGHRLAVGSLKQVLMRVSSVRPDLYAAVKTAGMVCCRAVRGSTKNFSSHSWGTAVDLYFGKHVDPMGDGWAQRGLLELYPFFHSAGWFWGAGWSREDSMHFEVAEQTLLRWRADGKT